MGNVSESSKVWLITGTSRGFGRCLVNIALARGDCVIATARSLETIQDYPASDRLQLLQLDVEESQEVICARVGEAFKIWGRIDVLVNNAGYALTGLFEEGGKVGGHDGAIQGERVWCDQYHGGDFAVHASSKVRDYRDDGKSGELVALFAACYASSKAAVRAFGEVLAAEVRQFNIRVMIAEPGGFKTAGTDTTVERKGEYGAIPDYDAVRDATFEKLDHVMKSFRGDAKKAMELVVDVVRGEGKAKGRPWPLHLFLGDEAFRGVRTKCEAVLETLDEWEDVARGLDFDDEDSVAAV